MDLSSTGIKSLAAKRGEIQPDLNRDRLKKDPAMRNKAWRFGRKLPEPHAGMNNAQ